MKNSAIILLSGGLDSLVALDISYKKFDNILALFFNYKQKAYQEEKRAALSIAKKYKINLKEIKLSFLNGVLDNALVNEDNNDFSNLKSVWVANRNGLFLNIAACYCDQLGYENIIFGANKEESSSFSDNKSEYIDTLTKSFTYSTLNFPKVIAPCLEMNKTDLVNYMIKNNLSFDLIKSCYQNAQKTNKKHCGECMSCKLLYGAIKNSCNKELLKEIF